MSVHTRIAGAAARLGRAGLAALALGGLVACGGGGGGGAPQPAAITAANAELISAEVLTAIGLASDIGPTSAGGVLASGAGGTGAEALRLGVLGRRTILRAGAREAFGPDTFNCLVAGTVRISGNIADFDTLTAGDVINATFTNCDDGVGDVLSGTVRLAVVIGANPTDDFENGRFEVTFDATFTAFRITAGGTSFTTDGTARLALDTRQSPEEVTLTGARLRFGGGGDQYTLTDFALTLLVNALGNPPTSTLTAGGTLASNAFTGTVDFLSVLPFEASGDDDPDAGVLDIFGAGNSRIRVTVLDGVNLQLQVDVDGDDVTDATIPTTWPTLRSISGTGATGSPGVQ